MNVFFGLPIPIQDIRVLISELIQEHPQWQNHAAIRWTPEQNHHLTVHFFGVINPELLSKLIANLSSYLQNLNSFSIKINKLYNFPKEDSKVLAASVELSEQLAKLYHQVQQAVREYGFPIEERAYLPHITLCRAKRRGVLTMSPIAIPDYSVDIAELVLYQTQATVAGNRYVALHHWSLTAASTSAT